MITISTRPGIIPACAGNTSVPVVGAWMGGDHPRMRGEHIEYQVEGAISQGSSPHARGTLPASRRVEIVIGIIPACAGNTRTVSLSTASDWDHPRMRGEHGRRTVRADCLRGSSPHARGTLRVRVGAELFDGIIPACAGNTQPCPCQAIDRRDHPRMRGEHRVKYRLVQVIAGSSPHARGTRVWWGVVVVLVGIIPACAGNTPHWSDR